MVLFFCDDVRTSSPDLSTEHVTWGSGGGGLGIDDPAIHAHENAGLC
jgi:hypothetical protein